MSRSSKRIFNKLSIISIICVVTIILDQLTKLLIYFNYRLGESLVIIDNFFNITYVRNFGAAFGFLSDTNHLFRDIFFLLVPPILMITIVWIIKDTKKDNVIQQIALSLILGGAIGNYIDRLHFGYVVDFLDFHYKNIMSWPTFNLADSFIVIGVSILIFISILQDIDNFKKKLKLKKKVK